MTPLTQPLSPSAEPSSATFDLNTLHAPLWRGFTFERQAILLHVPSSTVMEVERELAAYVQARAQQAATTPANPDWDAALAELDQTLPRPVVQPIIPSITIASLNVAQGCNLRCTYCFAGEGDYGQKAMMSLATATQALAALSAGKERFHVVFFGGEPLLNYPLIQGVVAWCEEQSHCRFSFSMTTNGTLLTAEKLAWLKSKGFALKISYDGPGLQDQQRRTPAQLGGSAAWVERKFSTFREQLTALRDVTLRTTLTKKHLDLAEEAIIGTLSAQTFKVAVTHEASAVRALAFTKADIDRLVAVYQRVIDRLLSAGDYQRLLRLDHLKHHLRRIHRGKTGDTGCGAGLSYLAVSASGGYYLCHRFNEDESERLGGVREGLAAERLAAVANFRAKKTGPCATCWAREWCGGGCLHHHKVGTGDTFTVDPHYCQLQTLEIEQALRVYSHLKEHAPDLLES